MRPTILTAHSGASCSYAVPHSVGRHQRSRLPPCRVAITEGAAEGVAQAPKKVSVVQLGCPKNVVDGKRLALLIGSRLCWEQRQHIAAWAAMRRRRHSGAHWRRAAEWPAQCCTITRCACI